MELHADNSQYFEKDHFLYDVKREYKVGICKNEHLYSSSILYSFLYTDYSGDGIIEPLEKSEYVVNKYEKAKMVNLETADVMTSSREFIKVFIGKGVRPGWKKQYACLIKSIEDYYKSQPSNEYKDTDWLEKNNITNLDLRLSFLSFLRVYDTIGNYTPAYSNKGYHLNDHWLYKLKCLKKDLADDNLWVDYITKYYMTDYVNWETKNQLDYPDRPTNYSESDWKWFFSTYAKLIIQRGYRIENQFTGKWTEKHAIEVRKAFKAVGLPEDDDISPDKNGLRYSIIGEWEE